jgi:hypothetical protein
MLKKIINILILAAFFSNCSLFKRKISPSDHKSKFKELLNKDSNLLKKFEVSNKKKKRRSKKYFTLLNKKNVKEKRKKIKTKVLKNKTNSSKDNLKNVNKKKMSETIKLQTKIDYDFLPDNYPIELFEKYKSTFSLWKNIKKSNFNKSESIDYKLRVLGVSLGKINLSIQPNTTIGPVECFHFRAIIKSHKFYKFLYFINDQVDSYTSVEEVVPVKLFFDQKETGRIASNLQLYDRDNLKMFSFFKLTNDQKDESTKIEKHTPMFFQDVLSLFFFIRGIDFNKQTNLKFPIMSRKGMNEISIKKNNFEKLTLNGHAYNSVKLTINVNSIYENKQKGPFYFWYNLDNKRELLKIDAKIKFGHIKLEKLR